MKRVLVFLAVLCVSPSGPWVATASATVHEIVAAYCSGGGVGVISASGFLFPPGVTGGSNANAGNFAKPVEASGAVEGTFPNLTVTSKPNAKFAEGTNPLTGLSEATADHPSAAHCPGAAALP
jgi:hypothetical protein